MPQRGMGPRQPRLGKGGVPGVKVGARKSSKGREFFGKEGRPDRRRGRG